MTKISRVRILDMTFLFCKYNDCVWSHLHFCFLLLLVLLPRMTLDDWKLISCGKGGEGERVKEDILYPSATPDLWIRFHPWGFCKLLWGRWQRKSWRTYWSHQPSDFKFYNTAVRCLQLYIRPLTISCF